MAEAATAFAVDTLRRSQADAAAPQVNVRATPVLVGYMCDASATLETRAADRSRRGAHPVEPKVRVLSPREPIEPFH